MREICVCTFGNSRCGKSQFISQFTSGTFSLDYEPTIEDRHCKEISVNGRQANLTILDTQGLELFRAMREIYANDADAFILFYDTTDMSSLNEIEVLVNQIIQLRTPSVPLIFVGTKIDKLSKYGSTNVIKSGSKLAAKFGKPHMLTSAKESKDVTKCFEILIDLCRKNDISQKYSIAIDSQSTTSDASIDGLLDSSLERPKRRPHNLSIKQSMLKLKKSMANIGQHRSMQNIRKAVSSVSLHQRHQPHLNSRTKANSTHLQTPLGTPSNLPQPSAYEPANKKVNRTEFVQFADEAGQENTQRITQHQLTSLPEFENVATLKHRDVCVIM